MFGQTLALAALILLWYMGALWVIALAKRNNSIADIAWGPGLLLVTLAALWWWQPAGLRPVIVTVMVAVWAVRLALHIFLRSWGKEEGWQYARWRIRWGAHFWFHALLRVFMFQGFLLLLVSLPALWITTYGGPAIAWLDWVGVAVWSIGFFWEAVSDYQLTRFLKDPANKGGVLRTGLWRYSRHPNYFGEMTQWWGVWILALSVPDGWVTILGPLTITFLILKVSGVPLLEAKQAEHPEFRDYARHTPAVFPKIK
jgi:steroid 5-alpha reductase family enzyme